MNELCECTLDYDDHSYTVPFNPVYLSDQNTYALPVECVDGVVRHIRVNVDPQMNCIERFVFRVFWGKELGARVNLLRYIAENAEDAT